MCDPKELEHWEKFLTAYKEKTFLWDKNHRQHKSHRLRNEAYEELLEIYKKIDKEATVQDMCNRLRNMRTAYGRKKNKVQRSIAEGVKYRPTLWYFDYLTFLDPEAESLHFDTIKHFGKKISFTPKTDCPRSDTSNGTTLRTSGRIRRPAFKSLLLKQEKEDQYDDDDDDEEMHQSSPQKRKSVNPVQSVKYQDNNDRDTTQPTPQSAPKRRIYNLLQKQEQFINTANSKLIRREGEWEVQGKAIGLQLYKLKQNQRNIAEKLIAEVFFYGNMGMLAVDTTVNGVAVDTTVNGVNVFKGMRDSPDTYIYLEDEVDNEILG